jgi:hypothetical protein
MDSDGIRHIGRHSFSRHLSGIRNGYAYRHGQNTRYLYARLMMQRVVVRYEYLRPDPICATSDTVPSRLALPVNGDTSKTWANRLNHLNKLQDLVLQLQEFSLQEDAV